mgnify:CR=1 FL=1
MILEYEKKQSIYAEKACEHVVNGVIRFDDLIITFYKPTNFSAQTKNFLLRDGHSDWKKKHEEFEMKMHEEWLEELGYDKTKYKVDYRTHEIINTEVDPDAPYSYVYTSEDIPFNESEEI